MPLGSTFKAQITVTLKDKKWNEVMALEKTFTEELKKYVKHQASNPGVHFQAKNMTFRVTSSVLKNKDAKGLDDKTAFYITRQLKDYDIMVDLMGALKEWSMVHDEEVFGRRVVVQVSIAGMGEIHLEGDEYVPNEVRVVGMRKENVAKMHKMIDALNKDIDSRE